MTQDQIYYDWYFKENQSVIDNWLFSLVKLPNVVDTDFSFQRMLYIYSRDCQYNTANDKVYFSFSIKDNKPINVKYFTAEELNKYLLLL